MVDRLVDRSSLHPTALYVVGVATSIVLSHAWQPVHKSKNTNPMVNEFWMWFDVSVFLAVLESGPSRKDCQLVYVDNNCCSNSYSCYSGGETPHSLYPPPATPLNQLL